MCGPVASPAWWGGQSSARRVPFINGAHGVARPTGRRPAGGGYNSPLSSRRPYGSLLSSFAWAVAALS
jgi:hypothetical protein